MNIKEDIQEEIRLNDDIIWNLSKRLGLICEDVKDLLVNTALDYIYQDENLEIGQFLTDNYLNREEI